MRTPALDPLQRVPVTYIPVSMQKLCAANHRAVGGKPYERFFLPEIEVPVAGAKLLRSCPMPKEQTLTPSVGDLARLLDHASDFPDHGYALLDGPTAYAQSRVVMPGVTTAKFEWWFTWHPLEKERYMLWFPQAHVDNSVVDPSRLADTSLSFAERLYDNPNAVDEYIGPTSLRIVIHFAPPGSLGLDDGALRRSGFTTSASGTIRVADAPDTTFMFMLHLARDTPEGMELLSRYWIGAHPEFVRFPGGRDTPALLARMGMDADAVERLAYEMAGHDMTEFAHLGRILPEVFAAFGET